MAITRESRECKKAAVVIGTPLQLINAVEYLTDKLAKGYSFDLVDVSIATENRPVIDEVLSFLGFPFGRIYRFPFTRSNIPAITPINSLLNRLAFALTGIHAPEHYDLIVTGHFTLPVFKFFLRNKPETVVVDDGLYALSCPNLRKVELDTNTPQVITGSLIHKLNHLIWGHRQIPKQITWFTRYDLATHKDDVLIKNTLSNLKLKAKAKQPSDRVMFIGMNVVECGIMSKNDYLTLISQLASRYAPLPVTYVAKYSEDAELVSSIADILRLFDGTVLRPKVNFEVLLAQLPWRPRHVASLYTSALINAIDLLEEQARYLCIDITSANVCRRLDEPIRSCYESIKGHPIFQERGVILDFKDFIR